MKNNCTELVFILDRSGSMAGLESDTIGGFNAMIEKQKKTEGTCWVSTVLSILSAKLKKTWVMIFFTVGFVCSLSMGYLSTRDFAQASMNWIAEGVNVAGQGSFLIGALLLHKFGLEQLKLKTGECA